ncbi:hypothetical protein SRHO_G00246900 [Serrasalmus rhombeus]
MAEGSSSDQSSFNCPVYLDLLKDPPTTPCGHSYSMEGIKDGSNHVEKEEYSSGPGDVECDFCTKRKQKAVKSCLKELWNTNSEFLQRIKEKETDLRFLMKAVESHKLSAQVSIQRIEKIFMEFASFLLRKQAEVVEMIKAQEKASVRQAEVLQEKLEQ